MCPVDLLRVMLDAAPEDPDCHSLSIALRFESTTKALAKRRLKVQKILCCTGMAVTTDIQVWCCRAAAGSLTAHQIRAEPDEDQCQQMQVI